MAQHTEAGAAKDRGYSAADIRSEFKTIQSLLPRPDELLQVQHSTDVLRERIQAKAVPVPRWMLPKDDSARVDPHNALRILLENEPRELQEKGCSCVASCVARGISCGNLHRQLRLPADVIRDQFNRAFAGIPASFCKADEVRKSIKYRSLPVPNFFLDPDDPRQFPPHVALLVVLQEAEDESAHMKSALYDTVWSFIALAALLLRLTLEVIGGAGAIWGGSEVFGFRTASNGEFWRVASIVVGAFCLLRFVVINAPQEEDEGDILGPAGLWSLRPRRRLRGIFEHPFHFWLRARKAMPSMPVQCDADSKDADSRTAAVSPPV